MFFVLSGYLLIDHSPLQDRRRAYGIRRLARIYPAYLVALIGVAVIFSKSDVLSAPIAYATLMQGVAGTNSALVPSWTLTNEVLFYALVPVLGLALARAGLRRHVVGLLALGCLSLAGVAYLVLGLENQAEAAYLVRTFPLMFWTFVPGMLVAALEQAGHPLLRRAGGRAIPILAMAVIWIGLVSGFDPWLNVGVVLGSALMVAWVVVRRPRVPRIAGALAAVSYGSTSGSTTSSKGLRRTGSRVRP